MPSERNYYELLGVDPTAEPAEIKRAYRRAVLRTHPDLEGEQSNAAVFRRVKEAYTVLANPEERTRYDRALALGRYSDRGGFHGRSFDRVFGAMIRSLREASRERLDFSEVPAEERRRAG